VNHVTYLTREIVPFIERLERAGSRRVIITVNSPPPPSWQRVLFHLVHGEAEEVVPGHVELVDVLWDRHSAGCPGAAAPRRQTHYPGPHAGGCHRCEGGRLWR
jgi:hypothetical protein